MTTQRTAVYIGSQRVSPYIGTQRVTPVMSSSENVTLTFVKYTGAAASIKYPNNVTLNGTAVSENSVIEVASGTSCTITITATGAYQLFISLDGAQVQSGYNSITYTFAPTTNHIIGVAQSTDKT